MRIRAVTVENIGGLVDQRIELPDSPIVAFAGPNGTRKTKLLGAMLSYWAGDLPAPRSGTTASATDTKQPVCHIGITGFAGCDFSSRQSRTVQVLRNREQRKSADGLASQRSHNHEKDFVVIVTRSGTFDTQADSFLQCEA